MLFILRRRRRKAHAPRRPDISPINSDTPLISPFVINQDSDGNSAQIQNSKALRREISREIPATSMSRSRQSIEPPESLNRPSGSAQDVEYRQHFDSGKKVVIDVPPTYTSVSSQNGKTKEVGT